MPPDSLESSGAISSSPRSPCQPCLTCPIWLTLGAFKLQHKNSIDIEGVLALFWGSGRRARPPASVPSLQLLVRPSAFATSPRPQRRPSKEWDSVLCGGPRCGHPSWPWRAGGVGLGGLLPHCRPPLHMLSTTFPVCASSASPPCARSIYTTFPQVDSRACDGKAVTSRTTSWPAETAPGYHHHPPLPSSDCELAESLLNSDPTLIENSTKEHSDCRWWT